MKKAFKTIAGVTLLEVMLVLAIAAMIIVMSVRYYQSANASQQTNALIQQVQGIVAAANQYAQGKGSFTGITPTTIGPLLPGGWNTTPWGDPVTLSSTATTLTINLGTVPAGVCPLFSVRIAQDNHFKYNGSCGTTGSTGSVVYTSNA